MKKLLFTFLLVTSTVFAADIPFNSNGLGYIIALQPLSGNVLAIAISDKADASGAVNRSVVLERSAVGSLAFDMDVSLLQTALVNRNLVWVNYAENTAYGQIKGGGSGCLAPAYNGPNNTCLGSMRLIGLQSSH